MEQHFIDKRKSYDKAIFLAKELLKSEKDTRIRLVVKMILPELQLEEDENIRNEIIDYVKGSISDDEEKVKSWIGWLNRQKIEIEKL